MDWMFRFNAFMTTGGYTAMAKVLNCRDLGFDCDGVCRAETEEEILQQAAAHAKSAHNLHELTAEVIEKARAVIQDE